MSNLRTLSNFKFEIWWEDTFFLFSKIQSMINIKQELPKL